MTRLLLGVDGGRTKTVALVAEPGGAIVGAGRAGCADIHAAASAEPAINFLYSFFIIENNI